MLERARFETPPAAVAADPPSIAPGRGCNIAPGFQRVWPAIRARGSSTAVDCRCVQRGRRSPFCPGWVFFLSVSVLRLPTRTLVRVRDYTVLVLTTAKRSNASFPYSACSSSFVLYPGPAMGAAVFARSYPRWGTEAPRQLSDCLLR